MRLSRVAAIGRKEFLVLRHDPRTVALMLLAPIMAMLIFGFAFGTEVEHVPVVIVNQDSGTVASELIGKIDRTTLAVTTSTDASWARDQVRQGKQVAAVIFPKSFSVDASPQAVMPSIPSPQPYLSSTISATPTALLKGQRPVAMPSIMPTVLPPKGAKVEVFLDTTNQQLSVVVPKALADAAQKYASAKGAASPIMFDTGYAFPKAKDARYIDYFVPGVMAFAITMFTTLLTLLAFVGERSSGTLDRLRVTPVTEAEIVLGYELAFGTIAAIQGLLILVVALLVYHVLVVGSVVLAGLLIVLTAIDAQAIGILVSAGAQREGQAVQFLPFIIFPIFLLSGIFVAVQALPDWLRPFSYVLPPTWSIEALRDVLLRGWGLDRIWLHVVILAGFAVALTGLAIVGLRRSRV